MGESQRAKTQRSVFRTFSQRGIRRRRDAETPSVPLHIAEKTVPSLMSFKVVMLAVASLGLFLVVFALVLYDEGVNLFDPVLVLVDHSPDPVLAARASEMLDGTPMAVMVPSIARQKPEIAALLVAIGKKESQWGERVPVLDGRDCYNYWGYRGKAEEMGTGGHTCFRSPEHAVRVVSKRLRKLVHGEGLDTPEKLIVWKCGYSCAGHDPEGVEKWKSDVRYYYDRFLEGAVDIGAAK